MRFSFQSWTKSWTNNYWGLGKQNIFFFFSLAISLLALFSCGGKKPEVAGQKQKTNDGLPELTPTESFSCALNTIIRPKVDFLFLWDNSGSAQLINKKTLEALDQTINMISPRFDYHIVLAPLMPRNENKADEFYAITYNNVGLSSQVASSSIVRKEEGQKISSFEFSAGEGTVEKGLQTTRNFLSKHISDGLFRLGAYTIVVVISSGDDNSYQVKYGNSFDDRNKYLNEELDLLYNKIIKQDLRSTQFRFISVVPHTRCQSHYKEGKNYRWFSEKIYQDLPGDVKNADIAGKKDSYDLCAENFSHIFDGVNQTIQDILIKHKYDYWVASSDKKPIDPEKITVQKNTGEVLKLGSPDGFEYAGYLVNQPTRYEPTTGDREPRTGHMVRLKGNGRITYPECIRVKTQDPADFYGYIVLDRPPKVESVVVKINQNVIPAQDATNGWTYIGHRFNQSVRVMGKKNPTIVEGSPEEFRTGYFIQLHGSAIYSNGDVVDVNFLPASL